MANKHRFRRLGRTIRLPVDTAQVIEIGDSCYMNVNDVRAANAFLYVTGQLGRTQANFAKDFVGIAMEASTTGDTADITIMQEGVFEFDCAAAQFEVGDLLGQDDIGAATALEDDLVIAIGENGYGPICRVTKRYSANTTRVEAELVHVALAPTPIFFPLGTFTISTSDELVTDIVCEFPFKAVRLCSIVVIVTSTGDCVLSLSKDTTDLDDTLTITANAPVGTYDVADLDDSTGDDIFLAGDLMSLQTSGGTSAGEAFVYVEIKPYLLQQS